MSNRRSVFWRLAIVLPAALALSITPARAEVATELSDIEPVTEVPVEVAATDGGADTGGDMVKSDASDTGGVDAGTSDAPRDTAGGTDAAGNDAARADGGSKPSDDEGDCGCRLGGTGRSSAALPVAGALAGLGLVIRRRRRRR
jgi:LPXTG-motif cell wall-anchored protein